MAGGTLIVGLGTLGLAFGARILRQGAGEVIGVDPDAGRRKAWQDATACEHHRSVAGLSLARVRRVFILVRTEDQVREVLHALPAPAAPQRVFVYVMTTLSPAFAERLGDADMGAATLVECPVTGGEAAVAHGALVAMACGLADAEERAFLQATLFSHIADFGLFGEPAMAKLLNNLTIAYQAAALDEVLRLGTAAGLSAATLLSVISKGAARSFLSQILLTYNDELLAKDMALLKERIGTLAPIDPGAVREHFRAARERLGAK